MSKVYFFHTSKLEPTKLGLAPASTIAIQKVGDEFRYGVSICSKYDNFSRKYGREVAENRLQQGFGTMKVPEVLNGMSEHKATLSQLYNLASSVVSKNRKWKRRITKFNMEQKVAKVIPMSERREVVYNGQNS